jgi:hypothetical protein
MDEILEALENEMPVLKRIINGFIAANPVLADLEVEGFSFKRKEVLAAANITAIGHEMHSSHAEVQPIQRTCKICSDENGDPYPYCLPGPCPEF